MKTTLTPIEHVSAEAAYEAVWTSRAALMPWMNWLTDRYVLADQKAFHARASVLRSAGMEFNYAITTDDDRVMGVCGLHRIDLLYGVAEGGYWVRSDHWREGIATQSVHALLARAFGQHALARVEFIVDCENTASCGLLEKLGLAREALLGERVIRGESRRDAWLYAALRSTWTS